VRYWRWSLNLENADSYNQTKYQPSAYE